MDYEEEEKNWLPLVATILLVLGIAGGGVYYLLFGAKVPQPPSQVVTSPTTQSSPAATEASPSTLPNPGSEKSSAEALANTLSKVEAVRPEDTVSQIAKILESGDLDRAARALGGEAVGVSPQILQKLQALSGSNSLHLKQIREVGELEINRRKRFALEWEGIDSPLFLDLARGENRRWAVEKIRFPQGLMAETVARPFKTSELDDPVNGDKKLPTQTIDNEEVDSLTVSDQFLQAALSQSFSEAKSFVDTQAVSDAKIAAMCILFEEGKYRLNPTKPLRAMFNRETKAGFIANVLTNDAAKPAKFSVNLSRPSIEKEWKISEINLDSLLADYANRVNGGDVYYTPLVPNPQGGETLVIFFGFDEETLAPRTQRQLTIVADVLKTDPNRKLTLSGHADSLGSDEYNELLSKKRAATVRNFLMSSGVTDTQIEIVAEGESRPRRPNETATGEDDPEGRRANRRTEIYLDFSNR